MRLELEVYWSPKLLENGSIFKAKVRVRLKLEVLRHINPSRPRARRPVPYTSHISLRREHRQSRPSLAFIKGLNNCTVSF